MVIDFHTHAFPDKLAPRAISVLAQKSGLYPFHDGSTSGSLGLMDKSGIDKSVVLSIATKPTQEHSINAFVVEMSKNPRLIPFGSVFPGSDTWEESLEFLKNAGIKGIKLHPEYQDFELDCPEAMKVYEKCGKLGLIVQFHAGMDEAFFPPVHTGAKRINHVCEAFPDTIFVAAHLGGYNMWNETETDLNCYDNLYLDTSMTQTAQHIDKDLAYRIAKKFGPEHLLLGSDSPWENPADSVRAVKNLGLSEEDTELILWKNAVRLLNL